MQPMLAHPADPRQVETGLLIDSTDWLFQPKLDGERRLIVCDGNGQVAGYNRDGEITFVPPPIRKVLERMNTEVTLDGELLGGVFWTWDAVRLPSFGITPASRCIDRVTAAYVIATGLAEHTDRIQSLPTALTPDQKASMVRRIIEGRGEGTMAKLVDSPYEPRRSKAWRKIKRLHTVDCVVDWLGDEKENMGLVVYDGTRRVDVGEVGRGTGDGPQVREGDVIEVRCQYVTDDGRLYQPTLPKLRRDKKPEACTADQLASATTDKNLIFHWSTA